MLNGYLTRRRGGVLVAMMAGLAGLLAVAFLTFAPPPDRGR